ncbi:hypothetical protein C8A05DRAFT_18723 [Staphylotrichum tortipilum]|uniref:Uncharacterized protein n=1 Tax=Staphylotrichum tortipilum TaxID=2831512 RepID=A0AAN6MD35_9PEZI|nr:hypothetical protein C8A05DRAFT_18723 [Staphylotrichum longicolle]
MPIYSLTHPHHALLTPYHTATTLPTLTRAWILQERLLAPRLLHFGPEELTLECLTATTCQCTPLPNPPPPGAGENGGAVPGWYKNMLDRAGNAKGYYSLARWERMETGELGLCWRRLVEDYSKLGLTVEGDVFPAVGGIARVMGECRSGRYVAGGWVDVEENMEGTVGDLLWKVDVVKGYVIKGEEEVKKERWGKTRPKQWRAPSWSWASVCAPVEFVVQEEKGVEVACEVREELKEGEEAQSWNVIDLDVLDGGYLKNLWADDDCTGLVTAGGEQPTVYVLLAARKLPRKELLCLVLTRVPDDGSPATQNRGEDEDGFVYKRIAMLEIFGGPPSPVLWGWMHNLLNKGEDAVVRIV